MYGPIYGNLVMCMTLHPRQNVTVIHSSLWDAQYITHPNVNVGLVTTHNSDKKYGNKLCV